MIIPWIDNKHARDIALRTLTAITQRVDDQVGVAVAAQCPKIVKAMEEALADDDPVICELSLEVLFNTVAATLDTEYPPPPSLRAKIDMNRLLKATVEIMQKDSITATSAAQGLYLLSTTCLHFSVECKASQVMQMMLVAGLRCQDWIYRAVSQMGVLRMHRYDYKVERKGFNPTSIISRVQDGFPPHLRKVMDNYGYDKCANTSFAVVSQEFQRVMTETQYDGNYYRLGHQLGDLILRCHDAISDGMSMKGNVGPNGIPVFRFSEAILQSAKVLRAKGDTKDLEVADMLEIRNWDMLGHGPQATKIAAISSILYPKNPYFHSMLTGSPDFTVALRAAKKGLKCPDLTPYLRYQSLFKAAECAMELASTTLHSCIFRGPERCGEGIAMWTSALEDAKTFLDEAPPDHRFRPRILAIYIVVLICTKGPEMSKDLSELKVSAMIFNPILY
jgi:hypothetical protein